MKKIITHLTACVFVALLSSNCSAWLYMQGEPVLKPRSKTELVEAYGQPVAKGRLSPDHPAQKIFWTNPQLERARTGGLTNYEIYHFKGLMQNKEMAEVCACNAAFSLGTSEILLPLILGACIESAATTHQFFAGYAEGGRLAVFEEVSRSFVEKLPAK